MTEQQKDKIKGVFYGQAIGDALGLGAEFLSKKQIAAYYPNGLRDYSQIVQDAHRSRWRKGDWTDDTDQFLCVVDSILQAKKVDEVAFAEKLFACYNDSPMGIGQTVYKVVTMPQFIQFPHKAAEVVWKMSGRKAAANGAIMRTSMLGAYAYWDVEKVIANTERIARVTHWDPRCVGSSVIVTYAISRIIHQNIYATPEEIMAIGERYDKRIRPYIELALNKDIGALALDAQPSIGYTLKAMAAGLWAYFHAPDFETGILKVIHEGGDADTNACIAGSLLGAKFGFEGIPQQLVDGLLRRDVLEELFLRFVSDLGELEDVSQYTTRKDSRGSGD